MKEALEVTEVHCYATPIYQKIITFLCEGTHERGPGSDWSALLRYPNIPENNYLLVWGDSWKRPWKWLKWGSSCCSWGRWGCPVGCWWAYPRLWWQRLRTQPHCWTSQPTRFRWTSAATLLEHVFYEIHWD